MHISKIRFAYFTPIKVTRKVVYNVAYGLGKGLQSEQHNLTESAERRREYQCASDELFIAALPTFGGRVPVIDPPLLRNFHGNNTPAVVIVTYGCRAYEDTLVEMQAILKEQGFITIGGAAFASVHSMAPQVGAGRPDANDLASARTFGEQIRARLEEMEQPVPYDKLPGNIPFKDLPQPMNLAPTTNEKCVLCMQCYRWCPTDAIPYNDPNSTDKDRCILCHGCIVRCPVNARTVTDEAFQARISGFVSQFGGNHPESEVYL